MCMHLRYEDMRRMAPRSIIALLAQFTGLGGALPDELTVEAVGTLGMAALRVECEKRGLESKRGTTQELRARLVAALAAAAAPDEEATRRCTPSHTKHQTKRSPQAPEQLMAAVAPLRRLFEPYNRMLAELVHPAFRWSAGEDRLQRTATSTQSYAV